MAIHSGVGPIFQAVEKFMEATQQASVAALSATLKHSGEKDCDKIFRPILGCDISAPLHIIEDCQSFRNLSSAKAALNAAHDWVFTAVLKVGLMRLLKQ